MKDKLLRALNDLSLGLSRMEDDEDYNIFDDWEIGEIRYVVREAVKFVGKEDK